MNRGLNAGLTAILMAGTLVGQDPPPLEHRPKGLKQREESAAGSVSVPRGTRVPLVLINSVSTKHAAPGDRVYLESVYPVVIGGRILIPVGTYVSGSVTHVKRPAASRAKESCSSALSR